MTPPGTSLSPRQIRTSLRPASGDSEGSYLNPGEWDKYSRMIAAMPRRLRQVQMHCNRLAVRTQGIMARINSIAMAILFSCLLASAARGQNTGALGRTVEDAAGEEVV